MYDNIPNVLSLLRIVLVIPFAYALATEHMKLALWLFFFAGLSDFLDGQLARYLNSISTLGTFLDPLGDKLLMGVSFIGMTMLGLIPYEITALVLARECAMGIGGIIYYKKLGVPKIEPNFVSKVSTTLQLLLIGEALLAVSYYNFPFWVEYLLAVGVVVTAIWSFILYIQKAVRDLSDFQHRA